LIISFDYHSPILFYHELYLSKDVSSRVLSYLASNLVLLLQMPLIVLCFGQPYAPFSFFFFLIVQCSLLFMLLVNSQVASFLDLFSGHVDSSQQ